jgi:type IV pilus assembly protein PilB
MCNLDISERRLPQDGRIVFKQYTKKNLDLDLRVSTAPLNHGEGVVMRILDKQKTTLPLPALGFSEENLAKYRDCIRQPYGMILHCGPTGSGKSMTLYSALNEINTPDVVIRTAEDPIEYTLPGMNQMQMHRQIGLTFASALRAFLRQDPDIILVGEIRDKETANIAVEAALTGHLLISTLHTNDAPDDHRASDRDGHRAVHDLVVAALRVRPAPDAARLQDLPRAYTPRAGKRKSWRRRSAGAADLQGESQGLPEVRQQRLQGPRRHPRADGHQRGADRRDQQGVESAELKKIAMRGGMKTLHQDSMLKVKEGLTTIEEAIANVPPDM